MTDRLKAAFAAHLRSGAELLTEWKTQLSPGNAAVLSEQEQRGLRLGLTIAMPADRFVIQVYLSDAAGEAALIDTLEQTGSINATVN